MRSNQRYESWELAKRERIWRCHPRGSAQANSLREGDVSLPVPVAAVDRGASFFRRQLLHRLGVPHMPPSPFATFRQTSLPLCFSMPLIAWLPADAVTISKFRYSIGLATSVCQWPPPELPNLGQVFDVTELFTLQSVPRVSGGT